MRRTPKRNIAAIAATALAIATGANAQQRYGIGRTAMPAKIADWNIDIGRDGSGLPPGSGTVLAAEKRIGAPLALEARPAQSAPQLEPLHN